MAAALFAAAISSGNIHCTLATYIDSRHSSLAKWMGKEGSAHTMGSPRDILLNTRLKG